MYNFFYNLISKGQNIFFFIWIKRTLNSAPLFETFIGLSLIFIRILFNEISEKEYFFQYYAPFYDTGSMMSFLICLEHIYVCYYLIIIIVMVYWFLYLCIVDFSGWTTKNKGIFYIVFNYFFKFNKVINILLLKINKSFYKLLFLYKEIDYLYFNLYKSINYNSKESSNNIIYNYFINNKNINLNFINNSYDLLGRSYLIFNNENIKYWKFLNLTLEFALLINKDLSFLEEVYLKKHFNKYLYYTRPKLYDFFFYNNVVYYLNNKNINNITLNYIIINLRSLYKDIFLTNQFKHSGIFEVIWAIFPTFVIICILIPSLILLYSFEDILSPKLSVKVIGNQWYWTYEFDNWIQYKQPSNDINNILLNGNKKNIASLKESLDNNEVDFLDNNLTSYFNNNSTNSNINKNIYVNYAFNSVIIPQDNLIFGTKRLLEVDNRLVLPTNVTIRFLITSADVLHAFAMPELGFKVDAVPGRLNQILVFINRPGIFYGQCSELCGANHAFMPIVIQSVLPETYLSYIENIQIKTDLI